MLKCLETITMLTLSEMQDMFVYQRALHGEKSLTAGSRLFSHFGEAIAES